MSSSVCSTTSHLVCLSHIASLIQQRTKGENIRTYELGTQDCAFVGNRKIN